MQRSIIILTISFVGAAVVTWLYAANRPKMTPKIAVGSETQVALTPVIIARHALLAGSILEASDVATAQRPPSKLPQGYIPATSSQLTRLAGQRVVHAVAAGGVVLATDLKPAGAWPASVLDAGMRAIAIAVNPQTSVAGLVTRGDYVDVLLSYRMGGGIEASRTILQNVRVLATDQNTRDTGKPGTAVPKTVTLEVTPAGAKVVALGAQVGMLSLVLSNAPKNGTRSEIVLDDTPMTSRDLMAGGGVPVASTAQAQQASAQPAGAAPLSPDVQIFRGSGITRASSLAGVSSGNAMKAFGQ